MTDATTQLERAIDRNAAAVVTINDAGLTRLMRSRLLARDEDGRGLWLFLPAGQADALDAMIRTGQSARVTVKVNNQHVEFNVPVVDRRRAFQLNPTTTTEAIRLAWPENARFVQRRSAYRIGVSGDAEVVRLRFWRIGNNDELAITPDAESEMNIDVRDLSASGVGGVWKRRRGEDAVLPSNQRLRVDVISGTNTTTLDAYVRFLAALPEPEFRRIGVQFMLNPSNILDRQKMAVLNGVTGALQRAELKRLRRAE